LSSSSPAQRFGAYEILYELKSGGMGAVLLGRRRGPGAFEQLVAIKTIRPEHAGSPAVRAMFLDEAAILARLAHPGIATVHDFGDEGGALYMVMEYVAGIPFRELGELHPPPAIAARAIAEACRGLHAAHEAHDLAGNPLGLVHRDISPDNLMLGFDGHVKVIDFGIALVKNRQAPVTEFGSLKGKPPYMSPEHVRNESIDRRSDVFSLGVVLWELLTGQHLFQGDSIYAIVFAVENQQLQPPSRVLGEPLPLGLDAAVMNALDRDVARRTASAAALAESLEEVVQSAGGESLEAWTARALADRRARHREWLANVVSGKQLPRAVGRSSAQVTELANPGAAQMIAAIPAVAPEDVGRAATQVPDTSIGRASGSMLDVVPRRRLGPLVLLLLLLVAGGGVAVYLMTRPPAAVSVITDAAMPDAVKTVVVVPPADAPVPVDAPPPVDAGVRDAGHLRTVHAPRDAAVVTKRSVDAAAPELPAGTSYLKALHRDHYLTVIVDGHNIGVTPIVNARKLPAGHHVLELVEPDSGAVVVHREIDLHDGETFTLSP
jgi:serine/threonine-protein kinase